ncbi:MAG: hypothetical protein ACR2GN_10460 [Bacteroidia bacterium]|nr:hypothetical protein [Nitrosopumilus sp.]
MKKVRKITLTQIEDRKGEKTEIIKLARKATQKAVKAVKAKKLPLTYAEGDKIVKEFASGKKKIIGKIKPSSKSYKKGDKFSLSAR